LARLGEAAELADAAVLRLEKAEGLDTTQLSLALGDVERDEALLRQLVARLPDQDGPDAIGDEDRLA
jgi:hypothetical protein